MAYADERGRREYYSNPINTGRVPDSVRFAQEAAERRNESLNQTNNSNPFGDWLNRNYPTYTGSRDPDTFYNNRENSYINWAGSQSNGQQSDMLFPTDWGGTTIGPKEEQEEPQQPQEEPQQPQEEPQDNPISAPKPITPQKAEEPLPEEPVDTGASSRGVELPAPVEPVVPTADQGGRDAGAAFRRAVDRGNRSDDESEFWSGNPLFPTDYGGTTIPGMPGTSVPKPSPVTRDQFLEGASNFLSPLMNFGVPTATGESEYTPRPYNEDARRAVEVDRALRSLGTIPGNVQGYMNDNGLEPSWLLTPAGREMLNDMPNSPLNAGTAEPTAGVNSFTDASVRPGNPESFNNKVNNIADFLSNNVIPGLQTPDWFTSPLIQNVADNVGNDVGEYVGRYADVVRDYNNDLSDIPSQNPYDTITPVPSETPFEPAPPTPEVEPVDLSTTEQANNPVNNPSSTGTSGTSGTPSQTDIANYVYMLRSNPFLQDVNNSLGNADFNTRNALLNNVYTDYQNRVAEEFQNRLTENSFVPMRNDGDITVDSDWENGGRIGDVWQEVLDSEYYLDDNGMALYANPDGTFTQPVVDANGNITYKPYTGNVHRQNKYSPDDILGFFVNWDYGKKGHEGEPIFKGMDQMWDSLSEEEKAGMNELLNAGIFGGSFLRDPERNGVHPQEFANLTEAEYNRLAELFYNNNPALQFLNKAGLLNRYDKNGNIVMDGFDSIADFFFKAYKGGQGSKAPKGSGSGSGRGYGGGYGGGGYSGYGGRGSGGYSGNSGYNGYVPSSSSSNQRQNRVYNIMKNWSF